MFVAYSVFLRLFNRDNNVIMKILHTADWHLGKRLEQYERKKEHELFLNWLVDEIDKQKADVLIVAGDVFDSGNPSNKTLKLYYDFLGRLKNTGCKKAIIVGGNHDSASMLDAPRDILGLFDISVKGALSDNIEESVVTVKDDAGNIGLVVCAVPFLRDKDIRLSVSGETVEEQERRIKQGIMNKYAELIPHIASRKEKGIPVIATGHLFTAGSQAASDEREIYVGNLGRVDANKFPREFDYIALGHLHKFQKAGNSGRIFYSGSPFAMSFAESNHKKYVLATEFEGGKLKSVDPIEIPVFRKLIRIKGSVDDFRDIVRKNKLNDKELPSWIEFTTESDDDNLQSELNDITEGTTVEATFLRRTKIGGTGDVSEPQVSLSDLSPASVFEMSFSAKVPENEFAELVQTFNEALELFREKNTD